MTHGNAPKSTESRQEIDKFLSDPRWVSPTTLYRYFTADGVLLYIGISNQPRSRHDAHFSKPWMPLAMFYRAEVFPTRRIAEWAESWLIEHEDPEWNSARHGEADHPGPSHDWYMKTTGGKAVGVGVRWARLAWKDGWARFVALEDCTPPDFERG